MSSFLSGVYLLASVQGLFPKDEAKAVEQFRQAAEEGSAAEEFRLGESFDNGRGVSKDLSQARRRHHAALC